MKDGLPKGWIIVPLKEVCTSFEYGTSAKSQPTGKVPVLRMGNIQNRKIDWHNLVYTSNPSEIAKYSLKPRTVLFNRTNSPELVGKTAIYNGERPAIFAGYLIRINSNPTLLDPDYLNYWLNSSEARALCMIAKSDGVSQSNINAQKLGSFELALCPLPEQRRIVAKLDNLLGKADACQKRLEKITLILQRFRQSVLAAACSGRLTEDWREENPTDSVVDKAQPEGAPNTPDSWQWVKLSDLAQVRGGVTKGRKLAGKKTVMMPYLRVANVQDGFLDLAEIKEIEALPEDLEKYRLERGDILFTEGGDRDKLGRGTVWDGEVRNIIHQNHIFRARLINGQSTPEYVSLASKSEFSRSYFYANARQTVNLASINLSMLSSLPLPLPPVPEQTEIVRRVEALFKVADQIEARYQRAKASVDKLTQSILAKAFRGELVPQDPDDEPASVLLERMLSQREHVNPCVSNFKAGRISRKDLTSAKVHGK